MPAPAHPAAGPLARRILATEAERRRKTIHLTVCLAEADGELLDQLRAALGAARGGPALSHAHVVRLALRHLASAWQVR